MTLDLSARSGLTGEPEKIKAGIRILLASTSPRRRELLALLGLPFEVCPSNYVEPPAPHAPVLLKDYVTTLAFNKASEVSERVAGDALILGADTIVTLEDGEMGIPLGKPSDPTDASRMLRLLSGQTHSVYTGICLIRCREDRQAATPRSAVVRTRVRFRTLTESMIEGYLATGESFDKAGAYGAQGFAAPFIEGIEGDYFNVVGLPLCETGRMLESMGTVWWQH